MLISQIKVRSRAIAVERRKMSISKIGYCDILYCNTLTFVKSPKLYVVIIYILWGIYENLWAGQVNVFVGIYLMFIGPYLSKQIGLNILTHAFSE